MISSGWIKATKDDWTVTIALGVTSVVNKTSQVLCACVVKWRWWTGWLLRRRSNRVGRVSLSGLHMIFNRIKDAEQVKKRTWHWDRVWNYMWNWFNSFACKFDSSGKFVCFYMQVRNIGVEACTISKCSLVEELVECEVWTNQNRRCGMGYGSSVRPLI